MLSAATRAVAFHNDKYLISFDEPWPDIEQFPDGTCLRTTWLLGKHTVWYLKQGSDMKALSQEEIPKNLLALCLILGLT